MYTSVSTLVAHGSADLVYQERYRLAYWLRGPRLHPDTTPDHCKPDVDPATQSLLQLLPDLIRAHRKREAHESKREADPLAEESSPVGKVGWAGHDSHGNS
ncbi:uncharacterized protein BBA_09999 [Beauveria bassiana ARSEF 2860]|uniref:Uncharacterized protein n=1 Tax=Beauveria bassiana (strain ARSEF 2860) TaxID=655819 RepID=J4VQU0_BEAB2|nr:uncharacterized protein BBA_09999 [Beauveria bassiana ARSEF 2860]EJP61040.1 hypothetical protein BBA_09999 [Beauveria bassiana ARSEF 2860]